MTVVTYPTLEHVAMEGRPYPTHLLEGCEGGLILFSAAFLGHNDAIHFAEAGIETTCVDIDEKRLREMQKLYPEAWGFVCDDAWEFARRRQAERMTWDAVSVDTFTGSAMRRSLRDLALWTSLADRFVTVTITDEVEKVDVPAGWKSSLYPRSERVSWLVLERE